MQKISCGRILHFTLNGTRLEASCLLYAIMSSQANYRLLHSSNFVQQMFKILNMTKSIKICSKIQGHLSEMFLLILQTLPKHLKVNLV